MRNPGWIVAWRPTKWSSWLALGLWAAPVAARAGACCVGAVTSIPTRLGECEKVGVGLTLGAEHAAARWDRYGALQPSSVTQDALIGTLGAGYRFDREVQVGLSMPARLHRYATDAAAAWGGGAGDVRAQVLWDPVTERPRTPSHRAPPVPLLTLGARVPTGRDWTRSTEPLGQDITGLGQPAVIVGASAQRTLDRWPWSAGANLEVGMPRTVQPTLTAYATVGRTLGTHWTAVWTGRYEVALASLQPGVRPVRGAHVGGRLVAGRAVRWRVFAGAETAVPVPGLGANAPTVTAVSVGGLVVR